MHIVPRNNVNLSVKTILGVFFNFRLKQKIRSSYVQEFQKRFSDYIGVRFTIGVSSARIGLYIVLKHLSLEPGDEVILSAYNFHPIPILIKLLGYKPVFVDIKRGAANIDVDKIEEVIGPKTKVIIVSHMYGYPVNMEKVMELADKYRLFVIEDCAHALGAKYKGQRLGSLGDAGIFSLGYGKIMPCFGGGMITLSDEELYNKIFDTIYDEKNYFPLKTFLATLFFYLFSHKKIFLWTIFPLIRLNPRLGDKAIKEKKVYNLDGYRKIKLGLSESQAKTGILQLDNLEEYLSKNRTNAKILDNFFKGNERIRTTEKELESEPAYLYYLLKVDSIDRYRKILLKNGIDTRIDCNCTPNELRPLINENSKFKNAEELKNSNIEIPNGPTLTLKDIEYIAKKVNNIL